MPASSWAKSGALGHGARPRNPVAMTTAHERRLRSDFTFSSQQVNEWLRWSVEFPNGYLRTHLSTGKKAQSPNLVEAERDVIQQSLYQASQRDLQDLSRWFIPRGQLFTVLSRERVKESLQILLDPGVYTEPLVDKIATFISPEKGACECGESSCTGLRIMFSAFLSMAREDLIISCWRASPSLCDSVWPINEADAPTAHHSAIQEVLRTLHLEEKDLVFQEQWPMRSPYFTKLFPSVHKRHQQLPNDVSLPWIELEVREKWNRRQRTFVRRIKIHQDHHALGMPGDSFALKAFEKGKNLRLAAERFRSEIASNQKVTHPNVVAFLTAFEHRDVFYIVLPWAQGGNLRQFWDEYSLVGTQEGISSSSPWFSMEWMADQCYNLADAIATIHGHRSDLGGFALQPQLHQDIKPENIVCFAGCVGGNPSWILKIIDFGLALPVVDGCVRRASVVQIKTYRPPEEVFPHSLIGPSWDVWCLGCLYLEFAIWALNGPIGIDEFQAERLKEVHDTYDDDGFPPVLEDTFFSMNRVKGISDRMQTTNTTLEGPKMVPLLKESVTVNMLTPAFYHRK
ncbi:serine/threonine protein kinase [Colletotrichum nymphaeae SA-01]|uniref:Serine/threonine protein kinase n=1 Tax=Colletotrichum nymphaeae SA-01 TaxID=1460502 RepID=A0A135U7A6_9PEZI|nr:serine/threonine protein kinase [Colletotrichum nymphaeae SA-01]